ncbi:hypothetical protein Tco_1472215 [Tanacetum coccineum]
MAIARSYNTIVILCFDLFVIHSKCGIIGHPKLLLEIETPLVERATPTIRYEDRANSHHVEEPPTSKQKQYHVDSLLNEDIDDVKEPPTSIQNPSTSKQKCSSHTSPQNKKRKLQSSDDAISVFGKDMSDVMKMIVEKTIEDGLCPCYRKLGTLEEGVSKMTRMMIEKNIEDDVGACFTKLETLEEDVSKMSRMMMEKNKEVVVGFQKLETLEEDVGAGFEKLEILEENVSKLTRMMMEKSKEDDMGACIEKLDKMGWGAEEPIYNTALLLFDQSADYRKLWLHLKPESCGKICFVKKIGEPRCYLLDQECCVELLIYRENSEVILQFNYELAIMQSTSMSLQLLDCGYMGELLSIVNSGF